MTQFAVTVEQVGDTTVLHLSGELDLATVPALREKAFAELQRTECATLAFDLAELAFLDSTGIGSWVEIRGKALNNGQRVVIREVPDFVARVLEIGALTPLFAEDAQA